MTKSTIPDQFEREGWQGQLARTERWERRVLAALDKTNTGFDDHDVLDLIYAFFQSAYHLRDWLQRSGAATKVDLDLFVRDTPALHLCRAVCNGSKHFSLDKSHATTRIGVMREYVPPSVTYPSGGSRLRLLAFEEQSGAINYASIEELMRDTLTAWQTFCLGCQAPKHPTSRTTVGLRPET